MTKMEFLLELSEKLSRLPKEEKIERLNFYSEMIEDRMEEGLSEEEAVLAVGPIDEIGDIAASEEAEAETKEEESPKEEATPVTAVETDETEKKKKISPWMIALLIVSAPVWLSVAVIVISAAISAYVALWSVIVSLWAAFGSALVVGVVGIIAGAGFATFGYGAAGAATVGASLLLIGVSIVLIICTNAVTKGTAFLTKAVFKGIKKLFSKEEAK